MAYAAGMRAIALSVFIILSATAALADDVPVEQKLADCYRTKDDNTRLRCYDGTIKAEVDKYKASQDVVRQEWNGNGLMTTRPFHMPGSWEFQFTAKGDFFQAMLYHKGDTEGQTMPQIVANQANSGPGSSYVDAPGDYYIVINAMGSWTAKAVLINK
jgi:hypothetical protein